MVAAAAAPSAVWAPFSLIIGAYQPPWRQASSAASAPPPAGSKPIAVIANLGVDGKIPRSERFSTASCVCLLLLQAAQAEGFGAQWLTGWPCYDRPFLENTLGLQPDEQLVGTIAMGTPQVDVPDRERPDPRELLTDWAAPYARSP